MLGFDDFLIILAATTLAILPVEIGAEIVAECWVHTPGVDPAEIDPSAASEPVGYAQVIDRLSLEQLEQLHTVLLAMQAAG